MPHIPGHRGSNAFAGFENIRQRMEGLETPLRGAPMMSRPTGGAIPAIENIRQQMQGLTPRSFIPPSSPIRGYRPPDPGIGPEYTPSWPSIPRPVPMPEWPPKGFRPPQIPPPVPMPEYRPPDRGPLNPLPLPVPMPRPGWPGPGGLRPQDLRPPLLRFPGVRDLLYRWPAPGTPPIRPETLPYYPSAPPPRRVLY